MLDAQPQHPQDNQGQDSTGAAQIFDGSFPSDTVSTFFEDNNYNAPEGAPIVHQGYFIILRPMNLHLFHKARMEWKKFVLR